jgi:hypothetical protein
VAGGEAAHQLVQRGLARPVDLVARVVVERDAALTRRHHPDRARRCDDVPQRFHHAQGAERVGHHHAGEGLGGHVGDLDIAVADGGVHEQQVERLDGHSPAQSGHLLRHGDVDLLDGQSAAG